jgi:hypothetical protein
MKRRRGREGRAKNRLKSISYRLLRYRLFDGAPLRPLPARPSLTLHLARARRDRGSLKSSTTRGSLTRFLHARSAGTPSRNPLYADNAPRTYDIPGPPAPLLTLSHPSLCQQRPAPAPAPAPVATSPRCPDENGPRLGDDE